MKFNYRKLLGKITEEVGTQTVFAEKMGISDRTISLKLNNRIKFKQDEIINACNILHIPTEEISSYFFNREVQNFEQ